MTDDKKPFLTIPLRDGNSADEALFSYVFDRFDFWSVIERWMRDRFVKPTDLAWSLMRHHVLESGQSITYSKDAKGAMSSTHGSQHDHPVTLAADQPPAVQP